jgi:glutamate/tyrosine decarboxylase-like PLP-dependent enzyme
LINAVYERYLFSNALNSLRFSVQAGMEREVIEIAGGLVRRSATEHHGGAMTSGETDSVLMSMLVNRERARAKGADRPQILASLSAHPAYAKAAHYFDMEFVPIPLYAHCRADVARARTLMTERTCVVVASAYSYPHGIMDPVNEVAALARTRCWLSRGRLHLTLSPAHGDVVDELLGNLDFVVSHHGTSRAKPARYA